MTFVSASPTLRAMGSGMNSLARNYSLNPNSLVKEFETQKCKHPVSLGHFQVGSYRYRSLIEGLYT